jgi:adhesin/invasin
MLLSVIGTQLSNSVASATGSPLPYSTDGISATVNGLAAPVLYASPTLLNIQVPYAEGIGPAVLGINNNGQIAGFAFQLAPSAPGILQDVNGNAAPFSTVAQGGLVSIFVTGVGEVSPALKTAYAAPSSGSPLPLLPISVTVGGVPAFLQSAALASGLVGAAQITVLVPTAVPAGVQPVVVTVNGVPSPPVNVTVSAALQTP